LVAVAHHFAGDGTDPALLRLAGNGGILGRHVMSANKRPSTSSLRRYLTSRPYVPIADVRRRFALDPEAMSVVSRNGTTAFVGLPDREAAKLQDLWQRNEIGVELSVEVRAPVVIGIYPMRVARFVVDHVATPPASATVSERLAAVAAETIPDVEVEVE
jgi:hypothetical protein